MSHNNLDTYLSYRIPTNESNRDLRLAWLDQFGFEMIQEENDFLIAFVKEKDQLQIELTQLANKLGIPQDHIIIEKIENRNWNDEWEQNFDPVIVEDQCLIRADFHEIEKIYPYEIVIKPKMAFGTGHHETTYMMIQQMLNLDISEKSVFDFGCGTGVLSVFALLSGAASLVANDIEIPSYDNTIEHLKLNGFEKHQNGVKLGGLEVVPKEKKFDLILANINRQVLTSEATNLVEKLNLPGRLLISGILKSDKDLIVGIYEGLGLKLKKDLNRGEWVSLLLEKN